MLTRRTLIRGSLAVGLAAPTISRGFAKTGQALRIGYILPVSSRNWVPVPRRSRMRSRSGPRAGSRYSNSRTRRSAVTSS
jgi:hypothetical protein